MSTTGLGFGLVGVSPQIESIRRLIGKAARHRLPVLLLGESGTGKEVVARAIHAANPSGQFVPIDCGALVGTLIESELFGHVKGSFSGAAENKKGLVELANGGTAFFDEIGDLPLEAQMKLLRLIQEREYRPVGALKWHSVDMRIISATHRDLKAAIVAGRFRQDLFYRINVFCIHLPPLRDHKTDIPLLTEQFLAESRSGGAPEFRPSEELMELMLSYDWPGNVRELKHALHRMAAMSSEGALDMADLPTQFQKHVATQAARHFGAAAGQEAYSEFNSAPRFPVMSLPETERQAIVHALNATSGVRGKAAKQLGIARTTLYRKMKEYGVA